MTNNGYALIGLCVLVVLACGVFIAAAVVALVRNIRENRADAKRVQAEIDETFARISGRKPRRRSIYADHRDTY